MPNLNSIYPLAIPTIKRYTLPKNIGSVSSTPLIEKSNEEMDIDITFELVNRYNNKINTTNGRIEENEEKIPADIK